ncbi:MAG: electron transport complex subunit RsxA [bacterium]|nr:electron transport complex subunit RsxA [bacterium]
MLFTKLFIIFLSAALVNNYVLNRFLGICPFLGVSKKSSAAFGMGMAVIFVMTIASMATWVIQHYLLIPLNITFLQTITFILVIATLVQFVEMVIAKISPALQQALGIYLPLITTNCAVLGVATINSDSNLGFIGSIVNGLGAGVGFTIALLLMSAIRERLDLTDVPDCMRGIPIAFIIAGLMSLAFMGFTGLVSQ